MNERDIVDRLAGLGTDGPPLLPAQNVLRGGRKARTRRRVLGAGGTALSLGVVVGLMLTLSPSPAGTDTVVAADGGDGAQADAPTSEKPTTKSIRRAIAQNSALLQAAVGPDFEIVKDAASGELKAGSRSAKGLPAGVTASVGLSAASATAYYLPQLCGPMEEKGTTTAGCVERTGPGGATVYENWSRWADRGINGGQQVRVLYQRSDDVVVTVGLAVGGDASVGDKAPAAQIRQWIEAYGDRLAALVVDPEVTAEGRGISDADPDENRFQEQAEASIDRAMHLCPGGSGSATQLTAVVDDNTPRSPLLAVERWVASKGNNGYKLSDFVRHRASSYEKDGTWFYTALDGNGEVQEVLTVRHNDYRFYIPEAIDCR